MKLGFWRATRSFGCVWCLSFLLATTCPGTMIYAGTQNPQKPQTLPGASPGATTPAPTATNPAKDTPRASNVLFTGEADYRIGAGDALEIKVVDAEELSGSVRVRADGTIRMHFLGRILALNKTAEELATGIADGLRGKYLFEPRVSVSVTELTSRSIYIQGAVAKPGVYQIDDPNPHLFQLLVTAGGLQPNHGATAYVIRRIKVSADDAKAQEASLKVENDEAKKTASVPAEDPKAAPSDQPRLQDAEWLSKQYTLIRININGLFKGRFDQNMFLQPGDIINIPPTDNFFVSGQVKAPGSFPLKEGTSLRQAIALAQGFTPTASPSKGIIFRENPETSERIELQVDMGAVMAGKKDDLLIYASDVVVVPASGFKTVALPMIQMMTTSLLTLLLYRTIGY